MQFNLCCVDGSLQNFGIAILSVEERKVTGLVKMILNKTKPTTNKKVRKSYDDLARFQSHWNQIWDAIHTYDCKYVAGEVPSGAQDARANFAFGGITAMYACMPLPFIPVYPLEVKETATGFKHSEKEDMIEWAYGLFPQGEWNVGKRPNKMNIKTPDGLYLTNDNEHLADAIGVGYAALKYLPVNPLI